MNLIVYSQQGELFVVQSLTTIEEAIARLPEGTQYQIIDSESLPPAETRDRWILTENGIEVGEAPPTILTDRNYRLFFDMLLSSSSYQHVLFHSKQDLAINTEMTVFMGSLTRLMNKTDETPEHWAALQGAFQVSIDQLVAALNEAQAPLSVEHIAEIQTMRVAAELNFTLPGEG